MSLVSWVQTAICSKPVEYFRLELACLLDLHPKLSSLLAAAAVVQGVHSGFLALLELKAGMAQCQQTFDL